MKEETIEYIEHSGVVKSINAHNGTVVVSLEDNENCSECPAAALCNISASTTNNVSVAVNNPDSFKIGDRVVLEGSERLHRKAIMLATVIPSIILIAVMTGVFIMTGSQLTACISGLGSMIFFFLVLWLMRNQLQHEFVFEIVAKRV